MPKLKAIPCALTVAGSDSGGGAGVQADLKTFAAFGVHGLSAVTCLTAQNPDEVLALQTATPSMLRRQLEAVGRGFKPGAMKTGMLASRALIEEVVEFATANRKIPLVVDPVMVSTSGVRLLNESAIRSLTARLFPLATVVTPNVPEAESLLGARINTVEQQCRAARELAGSFGCAVVVKGGHIRGAEVADIFFDGREEYLLTAPRLRGIKTHGTGCTFSAAIAAQLAKGSELREAVACAKQFVTRAITGARRVGAHPVLWPFFK